MPFDLKATTHIFSKTDNGGTQRVVAKDVRNSAQTRLVREHLHDIQCQFRKGDFSGPAHVHGADMPGLPELKMSKPDAISVDYREVEGGAELNYRTSDTKLVAALHRWFDAQLSDHGADVRCRTISISTAARLNSSGQAVGHLQRSLAAYRAWGAESVLVERRSQNRPQRGQFLPDVQAHSPAMGLKDGVHEVRRSQKWTAAVGLQPANPKPDRLLESNFRNQCPGRVVED